MTDSAIGLARWSGGTAARLCLRHASRLAAGCLLIVVLAGCAAPQTTQLLRDPPADLPRSMLLPVPFHPREAAGGAPAALASALNASGVTVQPEDLLPEIALLPGQSDLRPTIVAAALRRGRLAVQLAPRLDAVLMEVADRRPVIVLLVEDEAAGIEPRYAVVRGYDLDRAVIILTTARRPQERQPLRDFERRWWRGGSWALVVDRPDRLSRTANADTLAAAALALEGFDHAAAQAAFAAIAQRELALKAWMELGQQALAQGDATRAMMSFTNATRIDPRVVEAWSGLASALLALGHYPDAATAARHAIALGGPQADESAALLKKIEARLQ
jgi:tetratricopeptide (TPR) repeat protein